jgi:hypothetical protein
MSAESSGIWNQEVVCAVSPKRRVALIAADLAVVLAAYFAALELRFAGSVPRTYWRNFWLVIGVIAVVHVLTNYLFGLYVQAKRGRLLLAGATGAAVVVGTGLLVRSSGWSLPISVLLIGSVLTAIWFGVLRHPSWYAREVP